ncbi:hypothetical protein F8388_000932 [Cannabis sativa]|uniref:PGG domain-containing protein n=1 Tax=Cannabis sativa TaxID=3483 RepID=A0A7J6DQK3_CANSA|nr:hypothetical protein G4B88_015052 [Cannabis sativa]KAF4372765.1 hypothetical protein F8388_000932 [Cannabis sativa]
MASSTTQPINSKVFQAAANGEIEVFKNIILLNNNQFSLDQLLTPEKNTIAHVNIIASKNGTPSFLEGVLELCPPLLARTNVRGETPLLMAARYGHDLIVEFLINRSKLLEQSDLEKATLGVDKEFADETPLYMAVEAEYLDLVDEILNNCSSLATNGGPFGRNVLHAAVITRNAGVTRVLLEKEELINLTKEADKDGKIPLHYAVSSFCCNNNNLEIVRMLLEKDERSAYIKDRTGSTALHIAALNHRGGSFEIIKEILSRFPDSYESVDNDDNNFLHLVVMKQSLSTLKLILQHFPFTSYLLNRKDYRGNTPLLHMVATSERPMDSEILQALLSHPRRKLPKLFDKYTVLKSHLRKSHMLNDSSHKKMMNNAEKKKIEQKEKLRTKIANFRESTLVAAALIATVTFTAGFTLPGGNISGDDNKQQQQQGSAVLRNNVAFQAFIVTDTIALVLSTTAVFINLFLTIASLGEDENEEFVSNYIKSMNLTIWAMAFMVIAFVTGTYAVLSLSNALAIAICLIGLSFFIRFFSIIKSKFKRFDFTNIGREAIIVVG